MPNLKDSKLTITYSEFDIATQVRLKNRRVTVVDVEDGIGITFKRLCSKEEAVIPSAGHKVVGDNIKITTLKLSEEAAIALWFGLSQRLSKKGIINTNMMPITSID